MVGDRSTKWYQGAILSNKDFKPSRNLSTDGFIAVSHDCDVVNDVSIEPLIEFIPFKIVESNNGNFLYGKNPRKLHFPISFNQKKIFIEMLATEKFSISKEEIAQFYPDQNFMLHDESIEILQSWLAARYKRHALPNSLVEMLRPITEYLENSLKKQLDSILGVWIDYQPRAEIGLEERYELWFSFVYSNEKDQASINVHELVNKIKEKFTELTENKISLVSCEAYSESEFTLFDMRTMLQYRYDYLSYRITPSGSTL